MLTSSLLFLMEFYLFYEKSVYRLFYSVICTAIL
ncbi:MAG: hypothetical protein ACI80S_001567 [Pseudohongiellaceae bacterium]|jgi:hypothetical protein